LADLWLITVYKPLADELADISEYTILTAADVRAAMQGHAVGE
jgi:hypothetical protein